MGKYEQAIHRRVHPNGQQNKYRLKQQWGISFDTLNGKRFKRTIKPADGGYVEKSTHLVEMSGVLTF